MRGSIVLLWLFSALLIADSEPELVKSVSIAGSNVQVAFRTQVGRPYDAASVEKDLRALWSTGRFDDIRVEKKDEDAGTEVIFHVVESHPKQLHAFRIEPSTFGLQLTVPEGTPITRLRAHQLANQAEKELQESGFRDALVDYKILPFSSKQVDLHLNVQAGERTRVKEVYFTGDTGLAPKELRGALRELKIRRVTPPLPGMWDGWRLYPGYSPEAAAFDLGRLRSLYLTKGYFDASVRLDDVAIDHNQARIRIAADAGPRYRIRALEVDGVSTPPPDLCSELFREYRQAERQGILDFSPTLRVGVSENQPDIRPIADLTATIERGRPYEVGKIEFFGNSHFSEAFVRRNFVLDEGDVFDERLLRKSMARLNETGLFEPVTERNTAIHTDERTGIADVSIRLTERKRNSWNISGPVGPASFAGPLVGSINSRLPSWGSGLAELSTYTASISMFAFAGPLTPYLTFGSKLPTWLPLVALRRPYSPGEGWKSGFTLAPQIPWPYLVASYSFGQIEHRLLPLLNGDRGLNPELPVTVETPTKGNAVMFCEPPNPRLMFLRTPASFLLRLAGGVTGL